MLTQQVFSENANNVNDFITPQKEKLPETKGGMYMDDDMMSSNKKMYI